MGQISDFPRRTMGPVNDSKQEVCSGTIALPTQTHCRRPGCSGRHLTGPETHPLGTAIQSIAKFCCNRQQSESHRSFHGLGRPSDMC